MLIHGSRRLGWRSAAAIAAFASLACSESPLQPSAAPPPALSLGAEGDSIFRPNTTKYRDAGARPATGRAGNATLSAQALIDRSGRTDVMIGAGGADGSPWSSWDGSELRSAQVKGFAPDGELLFTLNRTRLAGATTIVSHDGLAPGLTVQVQGVIESRDVVRTGIVTVSDQVRRLPDLSVVALRLPQRAAANTAPFIAAVVRERNGDVGGWADCVLEIDGTEVDRAHGLWVDAGGTASCAFVYVFRTVGSAAVTVRLVARSPRDYDESDNVAHGRIDVIRVPSAFYYDAYFTDRTYEEGGRFSWRWALLDGTAGAESEQEYLNTGRVQDAWLRAFLPRAVSFPLTQVFARQATRDGVVHAMLFNELPADWSTPEGPSEYACAQRSFLQQAAGRGWLSICSYREVDDAFSYTMIEYNRFAGDVTYHSRGFTRYWDLAAGIDDVYSFNETFGDAIGRFVTYGFEYGFFVRLIDGASTYTASPLVWLHPLDLEHEQPRLCSEWRDDLAVMESCFAYRSRVSGVEGAVWGEPHP